MHALTHVPVSAPPPTCCLRSGGSVNERKKGWRYKPLPRPTSGLASLLSLQQCVTPRHSIIAPRFFSAAHALVPAPVHVPRRAQRNHSSSVLTVLLCQSSVWNFLHHRLDRIEELSLGYMRVDPADCSLVSLPSLTKLSLFHCGSGSAAAGALP